MPQNKTILSRDDSIEFAAALAQPPAPNEALKAAAARYKSQGLCDTTLTERFDAPCVCKTYAGNLGPCATFLAGRHAGRCVYCDHAADCHPKLEA